MKEAGKSAIKGNIGNQLLNSVSSGNKGKGFSNGKQPIGPLKPDGSF